jgi:hypothetical protein
MAVPAASDPDPVVTIPRPPSSPNGVTPPMPFSSPDGANPPMPSEVTGGRDRTQRPAAGGMWRTAMMSLRKMMRRNPRGVA